MNTDQLPAKLSELLQLALDDLRKSEADDKVVVDMSYWLRDRELYEETEGDLAAPVQCVVCMAGSVMIHTLKAIRHITSYPRDYNYKTSGRLRAIDQLRVGNVAAAASLVGADTTISMRDITCYHEDRAAFVADIEQLIQELREDGN